MMNHSEIEKVMEEKNGESIISKCLNNQQKAFYTVEDFPKMKPLEENFSEIKNEFLSILEEEKQHSTRFFEAWVETNLYQESNEDGWDVAPLMIGGSKIDERCDRCPKLMEICDKIPGIMSISYSLLKPGTHIVPHKGYDDYSEKMMRYHLGIIVPRGDIGIRVDKEIKTWKEGKSFIFDDFLIHEAWNFSDENRFVLIIDFLKDGNDTNISFKDQNFNNSIKNYFKKTDNQA